MAALTVLLGPDAAPHLREHAALALRSIPPHAAAVAALTALAAGGGFSGMIAEFTLEGWRRGTGSEGLLGGAAGDGPGPPLRPEPGTRPLTVAQLYLHADIDGTLAHAGQGDTGGIATLLVHLGDALLAEHGVVERVVTLSRGAGLPPATALAEPGHHFLPVPLPGRHRNVAEAWPLRVVARAGIRAQLEAAAPVDVLHLRMADVGSWAAAEVAADLGIPVVLTMAPDPHAQVAAREAAGDLTRATFGAADHAEHLTFRIRLLRELAERAAHVVVFPRPNLEEDLRTLLGIDLEERPHRVSVVPEGIDLTPLLRAVAELAGGTPSPAAAATLAGLDALLEALPPARRALPLAITVGRLHPVKGMATLVAAWRGDPALRERCNLLVVGGELEDPSDEEAGQLALIDAVVPRVEGPAAGLLLAGHRPNDTVAAWLAATRFGRPGLAAPGGVYVSASLKEEFGIAILEAMACGLVAVAPAAGGPATYVDDGVAGVLADTSSAAELARAVGAALDLSSGPGGREAAARAEATVRERFGIGTMAAALARVYRVVVATGAATDAIVRSFGYERVHLQLGRGSNPGVIRAEEQPPGEDDALRGFFDATRRGAVETLVFQAAARGTDLLWNPVGVARAVLDVVEHVRPDHVLVDHLAFGARLALRGAGIRHGDVVLGHPSALVVGDEVYGYPPAWPRRFSPDPGALAELRTHCERVRDTFTAEWNAALAVLDPGAPASSDAFAETGDVLLLNYPEELHPVARTSLLPRHAFLGSAVRAEAPDPEVEAWLATGGSPVVYVSLGSFLSVRSDVLARVVAALRGLDVRVALARGATAVADLGDLPEEWLVRETLPQVTLLAHAALAVSHGGNNSVTEALTAGVPLVLLPFSTDQFAGAAAIEDAGLGEALDPNVAAPSDLRAAAERVLALGGEPRARLRALVQADPGPLVARRTLAAG